MPASERLKQQQFNAAMEKYNTSTIYKRFSAGVAVANITLQVYLLWLVMPHSIGPQWQLTALMAAYLLTDFINGLVHLYMDNNDSYDSLAGPLIANFHLHHKTPLYNKSPLLVVYFNESGSKVWLIAYQLLVVLLLNELPLNPLTAWVLVYIAILSSLAEVSHYLCHSSTSAISRILAVSGLLLGKRHHARHHLEDNTNYAFLNGWSDPLLNIIARAFYPGYKTTTDRHFADYQSGDLETR